MTKKRLQWIGAGALGTLSVVAIAYVVSGLGGAAPDRPVFNAEWALCTPGDICVTVLAPCGEWQPVNARHEGAAAAYYSHLMTIVEATGMECVGTNLSRRKTPAQCLSGACKLKP